MENRVSTLSSVGGVASQSIQLACLSDLASERNDAVLSASERNDGVLSTTEKLKLRCSPGTCQVRWVKSKGAVLALLWNSLTVDIVTLLVLVPMALDRVATSQVAAVTGILIQYLCLLLLYPFTGWLADVYFGRYKVIRTSLWLIWAGMVATAASLCLRYVTGDSYATISYVVFIIALIAVECGIAGFKNNIVVYGADQQVESSSHELSAYVHWFLFTFMVAYGITYFPYSCIFESREDALLALTLTFTVSASVALCLDFCFKDWLVIEPGKVNPIKTIYQVLNYARKNKCPRLRSAFTYDIDKIPSRIELAKHQYGGPFTSEQVEDVKTFLRILGILLPTGSLAIIFDVGIQCLTLLSNQIRHTDDCTVNLMLNSSFAFLSALIVLPLYELVIYPVFHNFVPRILVRMGVGFLFYIAGFGTLLSIDVIGRTNLLDKTNVTRATFNDTCLFSTRPPSPLLDVSNQWLVLPALLFAFGFVISNAALYEFVLAQSPYSMKGLLMGLRYGLEGAYGVIATALQAPFIFGSVHLPVVFPSCSSLYLLLGTVLILALLVWYVLVAQQYKKRNRDSLENHHFVVEVHYDRYLGDT